MIPAGAVLPSRRAVPQEQPPEDPFFEEEITVSLSTVVLRVVDTWGRPILGLKPEDFRVRLGKRDVPVVGLDWVTAERSRASGCQPEPERTGGTPEVIEGAPVPVPAPNRLFVFFVQTDLDPTRISGQLRLRRHTRELLDTLHPSDRVAVVSHDSRFKLWQDFTADRQAVHAAIDLAMLWSHRERGRSGRSRLPRGPSRSGASPQGRLHGSAPGSSWRGRSSRCPARRR